MATAAETVPAKPEMVENGSKTCGISKEANGETAKEKGNYENGTKVVEEPMNEKTQDKELAAEEAKEEEVPTEIEPKSGASFPVRLRDGKQLSCVGVRKKSMLGMGIKVYGFGIYTDNEKLKDLLKTKIGKAPGKPSKEMYQAVIDSDFGLTVRLVIVFSGLTMNMVKKNFDEGIGASIKKLTGGKKDDELANKVMGQASDNIKLTPGSIIEISRLPGYTLQTKVMDEMVSKVENELLCRAFIHMYLGDDVFDKDAKESFGKTLLSLF